MNRDPDEPGGSWPRERLLQRLGEAVRSIRDDRRLSRRGLAELTGLSERFLAGIESGVGNVSVVNLHEIARALGTSAPELLELAWPKEAPASGVLALLGLRGAGKSTLGAKVARLRGVPFVELDALVASAAGMSLPAIFELHGEPYFRRLERKVLVHFLETTDSAVLATSGSIVSDAKTFAALRRHATTAWLKATAKDHWSRVVEQGDLRPMEGRERAMDELRGLLKARRALYAKADVTVDTSRLSVDEAAAVLARLSLSPKRKPAWRTKGGEAA